MFIEEITGSHEKILKQLIPSEIQNGLNPGEVFKMLEQVLPHLKEFEIYKAINVFKKIITVFLLLKEMIRDIDAINIYKEAFSNFSPNKLFSPEAVPSLSVIEMYSQCFLLYLFSQSTCEWTCYRDTLDSFLRYLLSENNFKSGLVLKQFWNLKKRKEVFGSKLINSETVDNFFRDNVLILQYILDKDTEMMTFDEAYEYLVFTKMELTNTSSLLSVKNKKILKGNFLFVNLFYDLLAKDKTKVYFFHTEQYDRLSYINSIPRSFFANEEFLYEYVIMTFDEISNYSSNYLNTFYLQHSEDEKLNFVYDSIKTRGKFSILAYLLQMDRNVSFEQGSFSDGSALKFMILFSLFKQLSNIDPAFITDAPLILNKFLNFIIQSKSDDEYNDFVHKISFSFLMRNFDLVDLHLMTNFELIFFKGQDEKCSDEFMTNFFELHTFLANYIVTSSGNYEYLYNLLKVYIIWATEQIVDSINTEPCNETAYIRRINQIHRNSKLIEIFIIKTGLSLSRLEDYTDRIPTKFCFKCMGKIEKFSLIKINEILLLCNLCKTPINVITYSLRVTQTDFTKIKKFLFDYLSCYLKTKNLGEVFNDEGYHYNRLLYLNSVIILLKMIFRNFIFLKEYKILDENMLNEILNFIFYNDKLSNSLNPKEIQKIKNILHKYHMDY